MLNSNNLFLLACYMYLSLSLSYLIRDILWLLHEYLLWVKAKRNVEKQGYVYHMMFSSSPTILSILMFDKDLFTFSFFDKASLIR